jgi:hypothetical protein
LATRESQVLCCKLLSPEPKDTVQPVTDFFFKGKKVTTVLWKGTKELLIEKSIFKMSLFLLLLGHLHEANIQVARSRRLSTVQQPEPEFLNF